MASYFTYILYSPDFKKYYIGQTQNFDKRIITHNSGAVKSTKPYISWQKVLIIPKDSRSDAMTLEKKLKNLNRSKLLEFIEKYK